MFVPNEFWPQLPSRQSFHADFESTRSSIPQGIGVVASEESMKMDVENLCPAPEHSSEMVDRSERMTRTGGMSLA